MNKKWMAAIMAAAIATTSMTAYADLELLEGDGSGREVTIWCWDTSDNGIKMNNAFTEATGIKVNMVAVESKDMAQKLQTTLASGGEMPDIAWCEATYRGKLLSLDIWEDLTQYGISTDDVVDYLVPLETSPTTGLWVGPECPSVAGMAYKRDLAKEYLGTDDRAELEAMFTDWDAFIEAGKTVREKSNGEVYMMSSLGALGVILKGQGSEPFIDGDKLNLEASMRPILEKLVQAKQADIIDLMDYDSAEEGASYAQDNDIFYPCANWSVEFTIKMNDPDRESGWGFMLPPGGGFPMGGTVHGVPKAAKNKEEAAEYIRFIDLSQEGATIQRDAKGNFTAYKPTYEDPEFYSKEDPYFGGQNVQQIIAQEVLPSIKEVRMPSKYDQDVDDVYNLAIKTINANPDVTVDELLATMESELMAKDPAITK